jgi:hypothetical protein
MTSVLKTTIVPDNSDLVATEVKNAADVKLATNSNSDNIAEGYSSVSSNDTHVKHLADALDAGAGVTITETNDGGDESLTIAMATPPPVFRIDNDTLIVGTSAGDTQTTIDLATAANWIGGASLESASELVHIYEVMASPGTYKLSDKQPQYSAPVTANRIANMQVNQAGWVGTSGNGLNATTLNYDNGTNGDQIAVGNYALIYDDASFTLGRGRGSGAGTAVGNLSVAKIVSFTGGAATGTITLEAGHQIAINDDDYIIVVDAGDLIYRYDGSAWYRHTGALFNDSGSNLLDLTAQYGSKQRYSDDSYQLDEVSDYTTVSTTFVDIDSTNLSLEITTKGGNVLCGFSGYFTQAGSTDAISLDVEIDGVNWGGNDGIIRSETGSSPNIGFQILIPGLPAGNHKLNLQWKTFLGLTATLLAGAGTASGDLHPQFWATEL